MSRRHDGRVLTAIAVVGSRAYPYQLQIDIELDALLCEATAKNRRLHIISGGAPGVDTWARDWAKRNQVMCTEIPAEWKLWGNSAGYQRNPEIWDMASAGMIFWDGKSRGTKDSFAIAEEQGKKYKVIQPTRDESLPW